MISIEELYKPQDLGQIDHDKMLNLAELHYRLNVVRRLFNQPLLIDRGFSTPEEQIAIYQAKNLPPKMGSDHLIGAAADVADPSGLLKKFVLERLALMEELGLYMEAFEATPSWVHFQIYPPLSGKRFFEP